MHFKVSFVGLSPIEKDRVTAVLSAGLRGCLTIKNYNEINEIDQEWAPGAIIYAIATAGNDVSNATAGLLSKDVPVVIATLPETRERALEIVKRGAYDMVTLGLDDSIRLPRIIEHLMERERLRSEIESLCNDKEDVVIPMEAVKAMTVARAYELCDGNINKTAARLGIARMTVYRLLEIYKNRN